MSCTLLKSDPNCRSCEGPTGTLGSLGSARSSSSSVERFTLPWIREISRIPKSPSFGGLVLGNCGLPVGVWYLSRLVVLFTGITGITRRIPFSRFQSGIIIGCNIPKCPNFLNQSLVEKSDDPWFLVYHKAGCHPRHMFPTKRMGLTPVNRENIQMDSSPLKLRYHLQVVHNFTTADVRFKKNWTSSTSNLTMKKIDRWSRSKMWKS